MNVTDLRIAFVTGTLQLGGSTTFLLNLAGELIRRGANCRVFCADDLHPLASDFERRRIPVSLHDHRRTIFEDRLAAVLSEMRDYNANVAVATLGPFAFETLRYVPANVLRVGMIQSDDPVVYQMLKNYAGCLDSVVGVSASIVRNLEDMETFRRIAKHYVPYGVPNSEKRAPRRQSDDPLRILYLGRLNNEQKRVYLFPQIAAALESASVVFHWTIAGDGPDRVALEENIKSSTTGSRAKFIGVVNYADIPPLLDEHDVFILTSDYEGLPLSLLEAMGHGLVPVVSDLESGIQEVVDETNGMRVRIDDVEGYSRAILYLDKNREELAIKSTASRERVRTEFSVEAMADRWLSVLAPAPNQTTQWPRKWSISPPFGATSKLIFTKPFRFLRRLRKRLNAG